MSSGADASSYKLQQKHRQPSASHPQPGFPCRGPSKPLATISPPTTALGNTSERARSDLLQAGQAEIILPTPQKKKISEQSLWVQGCHAPVWTWSQGRAAPAAPRLTRPVKPLHITSLMLMDFSLMPQIKVIGLGWPMNPAQLGRRRERPCRD